MNLFCSQTTDLFTTTCEICPKGAHLIWKSPIYKFVIPHDLDEADIQLYKELYIDVTDSVPRFDTSQTALANVLDQVTKQYSKKQAMILDFGAGKLRNTIYLLQKGFKVCAVEFEKMYSKTEHAKTMYDKAKTHGDRFHKLVFPHEFFSSDLTFDIILLINVCSIMPVPSERLLVLQYCREKLKENGYILWYTLHRDNDYVNRCLPEVKIGDGYYINSNNRYQTFYRDFEWYEIDGMFLVNGFRFEKKYTVSHVHARLYRKTGNNPTKEILSADKIRKCVIADVELEEKKEVGVKKLKQNNGLKQNIPDPEELKDERIYIDALTNLQTGPKEASAYHNLMTSILIKLFIPPHRNYMIEQEVNEGRKRIDIVMPNAETGFFNRLITIHNIHAPYLIFECKNYKIKVGNEQLDQLAGRLNGKRGRFGILTYRKAQDEDELLKRCKDMLGDTKYIITLDDKDIISMLNCKLAQEDVDQVLEEKMQKLIF